jgi:regulator of protease activity HflC (stomatin/prohibitin superfamily)
MEENNNSAGQAPEKEQHIDGGMQALVRMLRILFQGLRVLIILIFIYLIFSGMFRVDDQNEAMLFRFGKLQKRVLDPEKGETPILTSGRWYWAWPSPIDWVKEIPAQKSVTVSTENVFMPWMPPNMAGQQPPANNFMRPGADGYLLTGDTNILHAKWDVNYRVVNSEKYYLNFYDDSDSAPDKKGQSGTEAIIRNLLANAAIMETANWKVEDMLRTTRTLPDGKIENIKEKVQSRLAKMLEEVDLGVQIQSVNLVDLRQPIAVQDAFRKVNEAAEAGRAETLKARSYAESVELAAQGTAYRILDDARSYRTRIVETIKADSSYFQTVLAEYEKNKTMLTTLYTEAIHTMLSKAQNKYIISGKPNVEQELRLRIGEVPEEKKPVAAEEAQQ